MCTEIWNECFDFINLTRETILLTSCAKWFSYAILYNHPYEIDYSGDPEWDCSGMAYKSSTKNCFHLSDYETLEQFLEELTGGSEATHVSGCGLHWINYGDLLREYIRDYIKEALADLILHLPEEYLDALFEASDVKYRPENYDDEHLIWCCISEKFADEFFELEEELYQSLSKKSCLELFSLGSKMVAIDAVPSYAVSSSPTCYNLAQK